MVDILHRVGIEQSSTDAAYQALTTVDGLAGWWTEWTSGSTGVADILQFRFDGSGKGFDMRIAELDPGHLVRWDVIDGPPEWIGTTIRWDLRQDDDATVVLFTHADWREPVEFMHQCSTKWAMFLLSLKQLLEAGRGAPAPNDVKIGEWD